MDTLCYMQQFKKMLCFWFCSRIFLLMFSTFFRLTDSSTSKWFQAYASFATLVATFHHVACFLFQTWAFKISRKMAERHHWEQSHYDEGNRNMTFLSIFISLRCGVKESCKCTVLQPTEIMKCNYCKYFFLDVIKNE